MLVILLRPGICIIMLLLILIKHLETNENSVVLKSSLDSPFVHRRETSHYDWLSKKERCRVISADYLWERVVEPSKESLHM